MVRIFREDVLIEREHPIKKAHRFDLFVEREQGNQKKAHTEERAPR